MARAPVFGQVEGYDFFATFEMSPAVGFEHSQVVAPFLQTHLVN
jgi:hypothetical protein